MIPSVYFKVVKHDSPPLNVSSSNQAIVDETAPENLGAYCKEQLHFYLRV
jgi:hypothetical protein